MNNCLFCQTPSESRDLPNGNFRIDCPQCTSYVIVKSAMLEQARQLLNLSDEKRRKITEKLQANFRPGQAILINSDLLDNLLNLK